MSTGVFLKKIQSEVRRSHLKPPIETLSESKFKVPAESKNMTDAVCLVRTQEGLPGPLQLENEGLRSLPSVLRED